MKVTIDEFKRGIRRILEGMGVHGEAADLTADLMAETEARGVYSHGVAMFDYYTPMLEKGLINDKPDIRIIKERAASAIIDADNAMGAPATMKALEIAMAKAETCGAASVGITNFNHFGAGLYYANKAAESGKILYLYANANPTVAVPGGKKGFLGTNPYTFGAPAGKYAPFVLDMATSVAAFSKIRHYKVMPKGWGIKADGTPAETKDDIFSGGFLLPFGGLKGYGLSMMVNIMSGITTGASYARDTRCLPADENHPANIGAWLMCIDVDAFMDIADYEARIEDYIDLLHQGQPAEGVERIYYPGEIEGERYAKAKEEGVELSLVSEEIFRKAAAEIGLTAEEAVS